MYEINVDSRLCSSCGECVDVCLEEVYELQELEPVPINAGECSGCENCLEVCEKEAITLIEL